MSIDGRRNAAAVAFIALLALAVVWPAPVVAVNEVCCGADLPIDELSFLGREAPSWDVAFWCLAGIYLIAVAQAFGGLADAWSTLRSVIRSIRRPRIDRRRLASMAVASIVLVVAVWLLLDGPITRFAERADSPQVEDAIRLFNRLGGGMNPPMIVLFFAVIGALSLRRDWIQTGVAMALAGLSAGAAAQVVKFAVARVRPELWLGPYVHLQRGATSFPSGHTVGSFALAGVLLFGSRSRSLRVVAMLLAIGVGLSRILAFRHWASDVCASALLGLLAAWMAWSAVGRAAGDE